GLAAPLPDAGGGRWQSIAPAQRIAVAQESHVVLAAPLKAVRLTLAPLRLAGLRARGPEGLASRRVPVAVPALVMGGAQAPRHNLVALALVNRACRLGHSHSFLVVRPRTTVLPTLPGPLNATRQV